MKNLTGLWPNLFRAVEIAKTGNHSLSVYFDEDYNGANDDFLMIKKFCDGWFNNFAVNGDIKTEITKPMNYEKHGSFETLENIHERINKSLTFKQPEIVLDESCRELLKNATQKIGLSLLQVENIKTIAGTIAQMENSKKIDPWHISESIHYSYIFDSGNKINAEDCSINFGEKITIKFGYIDSKDIENAIKYLKTKK